VKNLVNFALGFVLFGIFVFPALLYISLSALKLYAVLYKPSSEVSKAFLDKLKPPVSTLFLAGNGRPVFLRMYSHRADTLHQELIALPQQNNAVEIILHSINILLANIFIGLPVYIFMSAVLLADNLLDRLNGLFWLIVTFVSYWRAARFGHQFRDQ
jgi:hypothetical protein